MKTPESNRTCRSRPASFAAAVLTVGLCSLLPTPALALDLDPKVVGSYGTTGTAADVAISGNYAYVPEQPRWNGTNVVGGGFQVIDIATPANPRLVGTCRISGRANGVAVSANYAYVAEQPDWDGTNVVGGGLQLIDISNPASPRRVGVYGTTDYARSVAISEKYAYVAGEHWDGTNWAAGLQVLDVSDPANPQRVGGCDTGGHARAVAVSGNYAYVAAGAEGLHVIDVSDPANPHRVGGYDISGDVVISGNYAYVAAGAAGLYVIDISDPTNLHRLGRYDTDGECHGVAVSNDFAYVLELILECSDTRCYTVSSRLHMIEISDPANPQHVGQYTSTSGSAQGLAVCGKYSYVAAGADGLQVFITNPANPQRVGAYATSARAPGVAVSGNFAYVSQRLHDGGTNYVGGFDVFDISNSASPRGVGSYRASGADFSDLAISGNYVYATAGEAGLQVIDVSNPAEPNLVGAYNLWRGGENLHYFAERLAVSGNYAYVSEVIWESGHLPWSIVGGGLHVIDISDPANPQRVGYDTNLVGAVAVSGNFAYLARGYGVEVIDMSSPANPRRVASYGTNGYTSVIVSGNYAYAAGVAHLEVVDVSNPANPQRVGRCATAPYSALYGRYAQGLAICGNYAYVSDAISRCESYSYDCYVLAGGLDLAGGLQVIDVTNPANPQRVGGNSTFVGFAVAVANGKVFVAAGDQGLVILHEYQPIRFEQIARQDNCAMRLRIAGPPGVPGRVQRSPDFRTWSDWLPVNFSESPIEVSDPDTASTAKRFYRLAVP